MPLYIASAPHIKTHVDIIGGVCDDSDMACQKHVVADIHKDARTLMSNMALVDNINSLHINC